MADEEQRGVWIAGYGDRSGYYVFETEIEALRYGVDYGANVGFCPFGGSVHEAIYNRAEPSVPSSDPKSRA